MSKDVMTYEQFQRYSAALAELIRVEREIIRENRQVCPDCRVPYDHEYSCCEPGTDQFGVGGYCNETERFF